MLLAEISFWSAEEPRRPSSHAWGRSRSGVLKKPGQLPHLDQDSENWTLNSFTPLQNRTTRQLRHQVCPWAEWEQWRYLSESCPEMKEPMRTPTKKREVVSGAFQSSSHTRFHCKRRDHAQTQLQRASCRLRGYCLETHSFPRYLISFPHLHFHPLLAPACFHRDGRCQTPCLKYTQKKGMWWPPQASPIRPKHPQPSDGSPSPRKQVCGQQCQI